MFSCKKKSPASPSTAIAQTTSPVKGDSSNMLMGVRSIKNYKPSKVPIMHFSPIGETCNRITLPARPAGFVESWDPSIFTNPSTVSSEMGVRGHQSKKPFKFIVHSAPISHIVEGRGIFSGRAKGNIKSWDVLCASIVNQDKIFTYHSAGVILSVPGQNILAASSDDLMSETNIGLIDRCGELVGVADKRIEEDRYKKMSSIERNGLLKKEVHRHMHKSSSPDDVIKKTYGMRNELLICTSAHVNINHGEKATGEIEIVGFFLNDSPTSEEQRHFANFKKKKLLSQDEKYELFKQKVEPLAHELGVPIIYFNGSVDVAE